MDGSKVCSDSLTSVARPASVSTGRPSWRLWRGTTPNWRRRCSSPPPTSNSGSSSWRLIRRRPRGSTSGSGFVAALGNVQTPDWSRLDPDVCSLQVTELECVSGHTTVIKSQKTELNRTIEELEAALKAKEEVPRSSETKNLKLLMDWNISSHLTSRSWRASKQRWSIPTSSRSKKIHSHRNWR